MKEGEMKEIAGISANTLKDYGNYAEKAKTDVKRLTDRFPLYI
jgi:glycine/serine hydroxymethyltransferase